MLPKETTDSLEQGSTADQARLRVVDHEGFVPVVRRSLLNRGTDTVDRTVRRVIARTHVCHGFQVQVRLELVDPVDGSDVDLTRELVDRKMGELVVEQILEEGVRDVAGGVRRTLAGSLADQVGVDEKQDQQECRWNRHES